MDVFIYENGYLGMYVFNVFVYKCVDWNIWSGNATSEKKQYPYTMRRKKQYMFKYKIKLDLSISKVYLFCLILHF